MKSSKILVILILVVIILWAASFWAIHAHYPTLEQRGQFGDLFGAVNSLFTGLAFAGLIATIFLQKDELALQREELKLQREEMILSRNELANQAKVQHALYLATVGQIKVASKQVLIEAVNMQSLTLVPGARSQNFGAAIESIAEQIYDIAVEVENKVAALQA